ncbi:MAG: 4a-hydroxytetrahydrobiopterin dehydratase, partial [Cyanobacteria bacterium J06626_14]
NFVESVDFVNQLVEPSELMAHHPDVAIAYNQVTLSLTTHDAGGLTTLDFDLAEIITTVANLDGDRPCLPTL